jgi:hypothetical protein
LALRGFSSTKAALALVNYDGAFDGAAPQLWGLFEDKRTPPFSAVYQVFDWNWSCNCRGDLISDPEVTLLGVAVAPGENIRLPAAGAQIGNGFQAIVVYADTDRIVLKYTRSDGVADGYALHLESVLIEPNLIALYRQTDQEGRGALPAVRVGQLLGRAKGSEIKMAIRDTGMFMDPRSRKDWWRGR